MTATGNSTFNTSTGKGVALPPELELGPYRIIRKLGQGGFGITYLACHLETQQQVVIKENMPTFYAYRDDSTLRIHPLDEQENIDNYNHTLTRFVEEARTLARLEHPNIVRVREAFEALGTAYYVMPYVGGKELHKAAPATPDEAWLAPILNAILSALSYLHSQNLLHRDIKPGNILLQEDGTPILIDFGTARAMQTGRSATMVGTPGYTPVEQMTTNGKKGPWTDLYALGATCYRVITGACPPEAFDRMEDEDPYIPLSRRPELRGRFSRNFLKSIDTALAVRAHKRWQSAEEWQQALANPSTQPSITMSPVAPAAPQASIPATIPGGLLEDAGASPFSASRSRMLPPPFEAKHSGKNKKWLWIAAALLLILPLGYGLFAYLQAVEEKNKAAEIAAAMEQQRQHELMLREARLTAEREAREKVQREEAQRLAREEQERIAREEAARKAREKACSEYVNSVIAVFTTTSLPKAETLPPSPNNEVAATLQELAEQGRAAEQFTLAVLYQYGLGVTKDERLAVEWLKKAATAGNDSAQLALGRRYDDGLGVDKNLTEAAEWYRKAAEQGHPVAQNNIGNCYEHGYGVEKDAEKAVTWYRKAADQNVAIAQFNIGNCYAKGTGVEKNETEALRWFRMSAEQGYAQAQGVLGYCYINGTGVEKNIYTGLEWFRKSANQGWDRAQIALGIYYLTGEGVPKDAKEAAKWFRMAAEQNSADAQYLLADCYSNGNGVEKDIEEANVWYRKAADQGNADAQQVLGVNYLIGNGVPKDNELALKYLRLAEKQNKPVALYILGLCYLEGTATEKNQQKAVEYFRKAADLGSSAAQYNLGICYGNGIGVQKDYEEAVKWYRKAVDQGNAGAMCNLGVCYDNGLGVEKNTKEAVRLYKQSAELGDAGGQYNYGVCFDNGEGVKKNKKTAREWYRKAAAQGHEHAKKALKK